MNKPEKLVEFEVLRAFSIVLLMFVHSDVFSLYLFQIKLEPIGPYLGTFMLGSFFFMAGYFGAHTHKNRAQNYIKYLWSKFIRLFPPYWLALGLFAMQYTLKRFDLLIYILDLQVLFSPAYIKPLLTLWYLSVVVAYYVIFGVFFSRSNSELLIWSILVFIFSCALNHFYSLFDERYFEYYFVFLAGAYLSRIPDWYGRLLSVPTRVRFAVAVIGAILFGMVEFGDFRAASVPYLLGSNFFILSWIVFSLGVFKSGFMNWRIMGFLSHASFFAYLYHRPIWRFVVQVFNIPAGIPAILFQLVPGSMIVFISCYYLQSAYDVVLRAINRSSRAVSGQNI